MHRTPTAPMIMGVNSHFMKNVVNKAVVIFSLFLITSVLSATSYHFKYPQYAIDNCIEGYVTVELELVFDGIESSTSYPTAIKIIESSPEGVYDKLAINYFRKFQYSKEQSKSISLSENGLFMQKLNFDLDPSVCETVNKTLNKDATTVAPIS